MELISVKDGTESQLSDHKGTVVVLIYSTWAQGADEEAAYLQELDSASNGAATFLLVCAERDCDADKAAKFAQSSKAGKLLNYLHKRDTPMPATYLPYHLILKDGECVMAGNYDVEQRDFKDWEEIAGVKRLR
eukprot:TRINITY_DN9970_c0_g1_i1.p1 TRINITY_DN9970_c0_g1~~TRINITY_DN9970_c0_g1_i1.p1  ORF type:complete len:133 (-),score=31.57 TRINITY_DN9970_c0_g1_i1:91-489(-)